MLLLWPFWRWVIGLLPSFEAKVAAARHVWFLFYLRFLLYYEFLIASPDYERIMITDVRDVWFQIPFPGWTRRRSSSLSKYQGKPSGTARATVR